MFNEADIEKQGELIHKITESWQENSVTWNTQPSIAEEISDYKI